MEVKIIDVGNSKAVILPSSLLNSKNLEKGDSLWLSDSPDGFNLSIYNPEFAEQMGAARKIMKKRRNVLHELAK